MGSKKQLSQCLTLPNIMSHTILQHQQYQYQRGSNGSFKKMRTSRAEELTLSIEHYDEHQQPPRGRNSLRRSSCQSTPLIVREEPSSKRDISDYFDISATNNQNVEWGEDKTTASSSVEATRLTRPSLTLSPLILPLSSDEPSRDDINDKQQEVRTNPLLAQPSPMK